MPTDCEATNSPLETPQAQLFKRSLGAVVNARVDPGTEVGQHGRALHRHARAVLLESKPYNQAMRSCGELCRTERKVDQNVYWYAATQPILEYPHRSGHR